MSAADVLRRAAAIVEKGWSPSAAAVNALGDEVPLYGGTRGDTARATAPNTGRMRKFSTRYGMRTAPRASGSGTTAASGTSTRSRPRKIALAHTRPSTTGRAAPGGPAPPGRRRGAMAEARP